MAEKDDKLHLFGKIWDGLTTPQKLLVTISLLTLLAGAFTGGVYLGNLFGSYRVASVEARYERQITELQAQLAEKPLPSGSSIEIGGGEPTLKW